MKGDTAVICMVGFFLLGSVLMGLAQGTPLTEYLQPLLSALATLAAAFLGATYAFRIQREHAEREAVKNRIEAGNKAIFELVRTLNQFLTIKKQFIDPHRNSVARNVHIMPMTGSVRPLEINFEELAFLFSTCDPNLLSRIAMFQQEVASVLDVINQRSQLHIDLVQPKVEDLDKERGEPLSIGDLEGALGKRVTQQMEQLTEFMVQGVDDVIRGAHSCIEELNSAIKSLYPDHTVIGLMPSNEGMQPTPQSGATDA